MPDCKVAGVAHAAGPELSGRFRVLVVALCADVAFEDDLSDFLAVSLHIDEDAFGLFRFDYACG